MYRRTISASCLLYPASRMTRSHSLCSKPDRSSGILTLALAIGLAPFPAGAAGSLLMCQHGDIAFVGDIQVEGGGDITHFDVVRAVLEDALHGDLFAVNDHL